MFQFTIRPGDTRAVHVPATLASGNIVPVQFGGHSPSQGVAGEKVWIADEKGQLFGGVKAVAVGGTDVVQVTPLPNSPQLTIAWNNDYFYTLHVEYTDASGTKVSGIAATFNVDPSVMVSIG